MLFTTLARHVFKAEFFGKTVYHLCSIYLFRSLLTEAMAPWNGINALDAMLQAYNMNALRESMLPSMSLYAVIVEGRKTANIILFKPRPCLSELQRLPYAKGSFIIRARKPSKLKRLVDRKKYFFVGHCLRNAMASQICI